MTAEQRRLERTRNVPISTPQLFSQAEEPLNREVPSFNEPAVIRKMHELHTSLLRVYNVHVV